MAYIPRIVNSFLSQYDFVVVSLLLALGLVYVPLMFLAVEPLYFHVTSIALSANGLQAKTRVLDNIRNVQFLAVWWTDKCLPSVTLYVNWAKGGVGNVSGYQRPPPMEAPKTMHIRN